MKKIIQVLGARPNYMKVAPIAAALSADEGLSQVIVNTGQHYDFAMAGAFVADLGLPEPRYNLGVGSGSHAAQTARVMTAFEEVCLAERPDLVIVVGDVNSTMAATLVAAKQLIPVAHVEAGLRSNDRTMPEEINRIVTDALADLLLTPSRDANDNLAREGVDPRRVHLVGNIMIDSLLRAKPLAGFDRVRSRFDVEDGRYVVMTLHRPSNVDATETFTGILSAADSVAQEYPVIFPVHPRTRQRIADDPSLARAAARVTLCEPLGYLDFLALVSHSALAMTDSGGLQEETTVLGIPCLTLRENTERPITVSEGTNRVVGTDRDVIVAAFRTAVRDPHRRIPELWDGRTAGRIHRVVRSFLDR